MASLIRNIRGHIWRYTEIFSIALYLLLSFIYVATITWLGTRTDFLWTWDNLVLFGLASLFYYWGHRRLRNHLLNALTDDLDVIEQLEQWASHVNNEPQYIPEPLNNAEHPVSMAINALVEQVESHQSHTSSVDQMIRENALLDAETGVGNRQFFDNHLDALLRESDVQGAVFFIHFKECDLIQTMYGHQYAITLLDNMIQSIKLRLQSQVGYFIARRSEFELALLLPGIFISQTEKTAKLLLKSLMAVPLPVGVNQEEFTHIGISYFTGKQKPYQIMAEADMALRNAQLQGPSQWFMYDVGEVEQESAKGSLRWRTFLLKAMKKNAFVIFFQPVIACDGRKILHHEVLSKVRDSDGTMINARMFIPMARKCGLNHEIDLLIFRQVLNVMSYEKSSQDDCSINLSIESLLSPRFVDSLLNTLAEYSDLSHHVIIEISEYHLVHHLNDIEPVLNRLVQYGVRILADKVGQYVVSANYLKLCPISFVKLHRSIVLNIHEKSENQIFVQSLKTLVEPDNMPLYALGVETEAEWDMLVRLGVTGGQGHYFTEPVAHVAKAI